MSVSPDQDELEGLEDSAVEAAQVWPDREFELVLRKAVARPEGGDLTSIMLREPTGAEWEDIMACEVALRRRYSVSRIGGVPMKLCALIGIGDLVRGEAYLTSFFDVGQAIGGR